MMDPSNETGLSKVTVECTDPSGLFPEVQSILAKRLPLKNLHWKSPTRPARSIESLNVDLVVSQAVEEKRQSNDTTTTSSPAPLRRHQIPGLRQTPYLKIYLLRCDDNEVYKTSARKALRDWIKAHSASQQTSGGAGGGQGNHDACEWLILHVLQDGDNPDKVASKWPGRGSTSILEKVKADFNGSSKPAVDRVAQLRLTKEGQSPQDHSELVDQLNDFVDMIKNAILTSFDLRVAQYEEDIREKDSQRSLPGWNFCTFFILKEGLARGFENVGLLEDALVGYDELAMGLESVVTSYLSGTGDQHGGGFLDYGADRKEKAIAAIEAAGKQDLADEATNEEKESTAKISVCLDEEYFPLDSAKKPYRDMILANNISIFDFRAYVFSRQLNILLKAAKAPSLKNKRNSSSGPASVNRKEDLGLLAEICDRAMEFITMAARTLRYDIECALADITEQIDIAKKTNVINNLVSSWTYAAVCQILSQTATPSLALPESSLQHAKSSTDRPPAADPGTNIPRRSSSLITADQDKAVAAQKLAPAKTGSLDLSSGRGELCQLARGILEEIGERRGWVQKWSEFGVLFDRPSSLLQGDGLEEVSLDENEHKSDHPDQKTISVPFQSAGLDLPVLTTALFSKNQFYICFEEWTDQMFRHYVTANRTRSAQSSMAEIAALRFHQQDYDTAAILFRKLATFYENCQWATLEGTVLELYTQCLQKLDQNDEYVRAMLRLLSQYASYTQSGLSIRQKSLLASLDSTDQSIIDPYIESLFLASAKLSREISVPLSSFFGNIDVNPEIKHYEDRDGFQMQLKLRFLLGSEIKIESVKVRLVSAGGLQAHEVWLERGEEIVIKSSTSTMSVGSATTLQGKYLVDRIEMRIKNVVFTYGGGSSSSALPPGFREPEGTEEEVRPYIWCYPPTTGLEARLTTPHYINLEELRTVEVEVDSGRNNISKGVLRVRPATAGLRLRIAETIVVGGDIKMTPQPELASLEFVNFAPESSVRFRIPYSVDENHTMLSARLEAIYETDTGKFTYISASSIISTLPISVNVQDIFKDDVLFSRFTVSPAMLIPLRVLGCDIPESDSYQVDCGMRGPVAYDVFPKQAASIIYKIKLRDGRTPQSNESKRSLRLTVQFTCLDEECLLLIKQKFVAAIMHSKHKSLMRLLTPHIVDAFRTQLSTSDMEAIGLLREVEVLNYNQVHWDTVLSSLREPFRKEVRDWLVEWHKSNTVFTLPDPDPALLGRHIVIPVDVPEVQVVHTAELRLYTENLAGQPPLQQQQQHPYAAVGHMIAAELVLRHTRRWCFQRTESQDSSQLEFGYEMHVNPEQWLIGGRRRGHFTAAEGESTTFAIMLLPQRAGNLLLPSIEIKAYINEPVVSGGAATPTSATIAVQSPSPAPGNITPSWPAQQRRQVPSEVDYKNHGETLLVLPDLRKTTVSLESGNPGLIESEARVAI
ncbi:putative TMEM1 family protein [Talaromyces proteolyticus]|uniref:TMEM1 family protein n=1 Tax=Talaromyces proteolyticus TaxID=1131652 RepID=A0AAD4Q1B5_9EURO|nr:putative TMEM1 family protein [Talaromyces proteolyticus]KAH8698383.1 putative TMEM1 family protein [Talaromyces proteolyticus]